MTTSSLSTSILFTHSVVSDSLRPHGLQHSRLPHLSITNSQSLLKLMSIELVMSSNHLVLCCPLLLLPPIPPSIRVFSPMNQFFTSGGQSNGASASASAFPMNIQEWFPSEWTGLISLQSKGLSRVFSNTTVFKASILPCSAFFMVQVSHPYTTTGKTIALTSWTFDSKVMSLLFHMLSRLIIAFLPRSKHLLISWLQSPSAVILEPRKIKSVTVFTSTCHEVMGPEAMILDFWMLSFKPAFSLFSFTFTKGSLLSAIRVVSSAYLRLLIFLPAFLTPVCALSSPPSHTMCSAYKLNKQCDNIQSWCIPFPILY